MFVDGNVISTSKGDRLPYSNKVIRPMPAFFG